MANIAPPLKDNFVETGGDLTARSYQLMLLLSQLDPITGTGSPEGVVEARIPRFFVDLSGSAGSVLYVKTQNSISGDRTKGWILV